MAGKRKRKQEWTCGQRSMRAQITGEGEPYHPLGLLWMDSDNGTVLGAHMQHPDIGLSDAAVHLREIFANPMVGAPRTPTRIRTASGALAEVLALSLADTHPDIEIVVAPTPEIDAAFDDMNSALDANAEGTLWLEAGAAHASVAGYFDAMAALHAAEPWEIVPGDDTVFTVDCVELGITGARIIVIGQIGESFGLMMFRDDAKLDAFYDFVAVAEQDKAGNDDVLPEHVGYTFDQREDLAPNVIDEVREHGWSVVSDAFWPGMTLVDSESNLGSPTDLDLTVGEAIVRAVTQMVAVEARALRAAIIRQDSWTHVEHVRTATGSFDVRLAIFPDFADEMSDKKIDHADKGNPSRLLQTLGELQEDVRNDTLDLDAVQNTTEALFDCYRDSPEAAAFEHPLEGPELIAQFAALYHGLTIIALHGGPLDDVLFETIPAKVSAGPEIARDIIDTTRAFYVWLRREHALEKADEVIELLGDDAVRELEHRMADEGNFGPAKAMIMEARNAGVDMSSKEDIDAFLTSRIGMPASAGRGGSLGDPFSDVFGAGFDDPGSGAGPALTPEQARSRQKKRKKDRKSARKSRKKNR